MRTAWFLAFTLAGMTGALSEEMQLTLNCRGRTVHLVDGRRGETTDSFSHEPTIYLSGEHAVVVWQPGSTKFGVVVQTREKFFLIFPDPPLPKGSQLVSKESAIDRVTGVFTEVTEVERGRRRERVEHTSTCEERKGSGQPRF